MAGHNSRNARNDSKSLESLRSKVDLCISYQTLLTNEDSSKKTAFNPLPDIIGHPEPTHHGPTPALSPAPMSRPTTTGRTDADTTDAAISPISNAPVSFAPDDAEIPNSYEFEIYRLRERVAELECAVRDKDDRIRHCLTMLEDELLFWRTGLLDHVWETMGGIQRRIVRLETTLSFIKDIQAHVWPKLEIPARWKKKS